MSPPFLNIDRLCVSFGGVHALSDVSFQVERGTVHGLIGPNGAGKTTLLNVVSRLVRQQSGQIFLGERNMSDLPPDAIADLGIARTFQNFGLMPGFSVLENIKCGYHCRHRATLLDEYLLPWRRNRFERDAAERASVVMQQTGLDRMAGQLVQRLSYGTRKSVELARAMMTQPSLLLLDEPTAGLTAPEMDRLQSMLAAFRKPGDLTILVVTHHLEFLAEVADTVTVLDLGKVIASDTPDAVRNDEKVVRAYIGESL